MNIKEKLKSIFKLENYINLNVLKEEVIEEREGVDFEGNLKSCSPAKSDLICTEVFTQEDAFAVQCEKDGHEAVQCGCHDWICIKGH